MVQVYDLIFGTYRPRAANGMLVEMTYLEPDADHRLGQAFDGAVSAVGDQPE
jgi:hypothetical protein